MSRNGHHFIYIDVALKESSEVCVVLFSHRISQKCSPNKQSVANIFSSLHNSFDLQLHVYLYKIYFTYSAPAPCINDITTLCQLFYLFQFHRDKKPWVVRFHQLQIYYIHICVITPLPYCQFITAKVE